MSPRWQGQRDLREYGHNTVLARRGGWTCSGKQSSPRWIVYRDDLTSVGYVAHGDNNFFFTTVVSSRGYRVISFAYLCWLEHVCVLLSDEGTKEY